MIPSPPKKRHTRRITAAFIKRLSSWLVVSTALTIGIAKSAQAATYYWDPDANPQNNSVSLNTGLGGAGTWDTSSAFWFDPVGNTDTLWTNLGTETAVFGGTAGTGAVAVSGSLNVGSLQFLTTGYALSGGQITLGTAGSNLFVNSGLATTINSVIAGSSGLGLNGGGTLTLTAANQYTGNTTLSNGAGLALTFSAGTQNDIIQNSSPLVLSGGTLTLTGASGVADSQTFAGTTVSGGGVITLTQNGATSLTVALGAITQTTGGTLSFTTVPSTSGVIATTSNTNVSGILGTWAAVGATTSLRYATVNGSNQIVAYTGGTAAATGANLTDTTGAVNYDLTAAAGAVATTFSANTIRYTGALGTTAPGTTSFTVNGLMNAGTGTWTIGGTTNITIGQNKELVIILNAQAMIVTSVIQDNGGGASGLTLASSGGGALTLSKANLYTGPTAINSGSLTLGINNAVNSLSAVTINSGTLAMSTFSDSVASVSLKSGTISGTGTLTSAAAFDVQAGTVNAVLAGSNGLVKSGPGTVFLSPASGVAEAFTGGVTIKAGTLTAGTGGTVDVLGSNTITIGDTSGSADARFVYAGTATTYANPIVLATGTTGTLSIGTTNSTTVTSLTGGITGNNNLTLSGTTLTVAVTYASVNNTGTVTAAQNSSGSTVITTLGANVTGLTQAGTGAFTITNAVTPNSATSINSPLNIGTGLLTLTGGYSAGAGTNNLNFRANNTGGITIGAIATTGTITNSGTGSGTVTISGAIGANVTNVLQNSATSALTLSSGSNAYTGTTTVTQGTLNFAGTPATGATSGLGNSSTNIVLGGASTLGKLVYTGVAATMTRNFTINAGGGEIDSTTATLTLLPGAPIDLTNGPLTIGGASNVTVGSATTATNLFTGTNTLTKIGAGTLSFSTLGGTTATTAALPITINAGTLSFVTTNVTTNNILGTGLITIATGAALTANFGGGTGSTQSNAITITGASGTATIQTTSGALNFNTGPITFAAGATSATILKLNNTNATAATLTLGGAISGTGNIQFNPSSTASPITLSGAQNEIGTISNVGTSTSTSTLAATATIGAGISGISQAGANPFTVAAAVPLSASLNSFTSTGAGLFTFSGGFTGAQPLTLIANSTGGITVQTAAVNNGGNVTLNANNTGAITISSAVTGTGTITNSGTGGAVSTISGNISSNVSNVIESGANSALILSGTNTYTGTSTATAGLLSFTTALAIPGYSTSPATAFGTFASPRMSASTGATIALPFGAATNAVTTTDIANFLNGTYNVFGSGSSLGIDTTNAASSTTALSTLISDTTVGPLGFTKMGTQTLTVNSANSYTGPTLIANGTLSVGIINSVNSGHPSDLGAPATIANGTLSLGFGTNTGILSYTGSGETTDRVINLAGSTGGGGIDQSGTGLLKFSSNVTIAAGTKTLTLSGSTAGTGEISGAIPGSFSNTATASTTPFTIAKTGTGTWTLSGTGNTAATLTISGGVLDTGPNGLTLGNAGAATIQGNGASGNSATILGRIFLVGVGGSVNGADVGATVAGFTLNLNAIISGGPANNVDFFSAGTTILNGANTFAGQVQVNGTTLVVSTINNAAGTTFPGGSSLGIPSGTSVKGNANSTLELVSGVLKYVGTGETTDRAFDLGGTTSATTLDQSGTGLLKFTGTNTTGGAGIKTMTLQGSTAGTGEIGGAILDNSGTNTTAITKAGTGTWTLSGANSYTGATTVNAGNLILSTGSGTGKLANSSITINSGAILSPLAGYTAGNAATSTAGGKLTLSAGGILNMADGTVGTFTLTQGATFAGNAATFNGGAVVLDIGSAGADTLVSTVGTATSTGSNAIAFNAVGGNLTPGNPYTIIQAGGTLSLANFYLATPNIYAGGQLYTLSLSLSGTNLSVLVTPNGGAPATPSSAFWTGAIGSSWATQNPGFATNFAATATGVPDTLALPGAGTNVTFTANSASNLNTTLDQSFTINSLAFAGTGTSNTAGSTIASGTGTNALTINAAAMNGSALGNGITVNAGSGANTISADVVLGASQTWTNNSTSALTISGVISDSGSLFSLTTAGAGTIVLSNAANTYGGLTSIGSGVLSVTTLANGGLPSSIGQSSNAASSLLFSGTGSLQYTGGSVVIDRNFTINPGVTATIDVAQNAATLELPGVTGAVTTGSLTKAGAGALTLDGANTYTGNTTVTNGTLNFTGTASLTGLPASSKLNINPTAGNNGVVNYSSSATSTLFAVTGATVANTASAFYQTAGIINITPGVVTSAQSVVGGNSAYGYYSITGGVFHDTTGTAAGARFTVSNQGTASATNGTGIGVQTGVVFVGGTGFIDHTNAEWWLNYSLGEITVADSGKIDHTGSSQPFALFMNHAAGVTGGGYGVLNLAGANAQVITGAQPIRFGNSTTAGQGEGQSGFVNLAAGTLSAGLNSNTMLPSAPTTINNIYYNYAGGTLKATASLSQFAPSSNASALVISTIYGAIDNSAVAGAPSFNGGLTIDTNTFTVTVPAAMPLLGATGDRVTQADLTVTGGSGYIGAPAVLFSKPASASGVPAAGYALISGGSVVGIVITDPGVYAPGETPVITLIGGGAAVPATVTSGALSTANSNTGGLTKLNAGTVTISGAANTFGGVVDIKGGLLTVTSLANGGVPSTLGRSSNAASNVLLDGGVLGYSSTTTAGTTDRNFTFAASGGGFDASGTVAAATFTLTTSNNIVITSGLGAATFVLQGSGTAATGAGTLGSLLSDGTGTTIGLTKLGAGQWNLSNVANSYSGPTTISAGILSANKLDIGGNNSSIGSSSNAASSLVLSGGTLQYTGAGAATDRNFTFGNATTAAGGGLDSEGTGALVIANMTAVNTAAGTQTLTLTANAASGANTIGNIVDSSGTALTAVTKAGAGSWTLGGANAYSGPTLISAGTLTITGTNSSASPYSVNAASTVLNINSSGTVNGSTLSMVSGATVNLNSGILALTGNITAATGTTGLNFNGGTLKNGGAGPITISTNLPIAVQAGGGTIDTTGGNITSSSTIGNTASPGTLNVIGGNTLQSQVGATFTGNASVTGAGTTLQFATAAAAYSGLWTIGAGANLDINNVGNFSFGGLAGAGTVLNTGASAVRTITITGTGGNIFSGAIQQPTPSTTSATGVTLNLTSGTQTFTGNNTYGGPTTITAGTLALTAGSLGNTAISVALGGTLAPRVGSASFTAGTSGAGTLGASLNMASGAALSMLDGAIGTLNINQNTSFALTGLTLNNAVFNLDLGATGVDQIIVAGSAVSAAISGINTVNITTLGTSLVPGTYNLLSAPGIAAANAFFKFSNGTATEAVVLGANTYSLTLSAVAGIEQITVGSPITNMTWTGQTNGIGVANSVWTATPAGNNNFADTSPAAVDYADGSAVTFQDLNTITVSNVTNGTVTIDAAGVQPGTVTVNNSAVAYTFQNASGNIGIAGATGLTKSGNGTLTLLGANTYTGGTAINGGVVNLGVGEGAGFGPLGNGGPITFAGGTLQYSAANNFDYSSRFSTGANQAISIDTHGQNVTFATALTSGGGTLTKIGNGILTLTSPATYTGVTVVNGGTLKISAANAALGGIGSTTITINSGAILETTLGDALGFTANRNALIINGGTVLNNTAGTRDTLINTVTMTGGFLSGTSVGDSNTGAYSLNNAVSVIATSDASGNPATISANVSTQVVAVFQVNRGAFAAPGAPDLLINGPITPYAATTNGVTFKGSGIVNLTGANTYKGSTTILGGSLGGIVNANSTQALSNNLAGLVMGDTTNNSGTLNVNQSNSVTSLAVNSIGTTLNTNTITIAPTKTLTVTGNVAVGPVATVAGQLTKLVVNGGGALAITTAAAGTVAIGGNSPTNNFSENATLDLTGLASAVINASATGTITIGNVAPTNIAGNQAALLLPTPAVSNTTPVSTLTATTLTIGPGSGNAGAAGQTNQLVLGSGLTTLNVGTVNIGTGGRDFGQMTYSGANGNVKLRAANGTSRAAVNIGTGTSISTGVAPGAGVTNLVDFSGHSADLLISTLNLGTENRGAGYTNTFSFDTGTLDVTSIIAATRTAESANGANLPRITNSTINLGGGAVTIGSGILQFGDSAGTYTVSGQTVTMNATLNISGGTVAIGATAGTAITMAKLSNTSSTNATTVNAIINISGGTTTLSGNVVKVGTSGTSTGAVSDNATINLTNGTLDMGGFAIGSGTQTVVLVAQAGTLRSLGDLNGGGTLTKTTSGTLTIAGTNNYAGLTDVTAGKVIVAGSIAGSTQTAAGATLASGGNGAAWAIGGNVTLLSTGAGGGTLSPGDSGDSTGLTTVGKLTVGGNMTLGGAGQPAHLAMEIGGTTGGTLYDQIQVASGSTVSLANANLDLSVVNSNTFNPTSLTIATFDGSGNVATQGSLIFLVTGSSQVVSGAFANAGAADGNLNGFGTYTVGGQEFAISYTASATANSGAGSFTGGHDIALMAIPEPNSLAMLAGSVGLALSLQRFRRRRNG